MDTGPLPPPPHRTHMCYLVGQPLEGSMTMSMEPVQRLQVEQP